MSLRVGIIWAGFGSRVHAPILKSHPDSELVALCSMRPVKAKTAASELEIPLWFDDWRSMIQDNSLDLVVIASQPVHHAEMAVHALHSGLYVLCEKPCRIALNSKEAFNMSLAAKGTNRNLFVNFEWRYLPERQTIKRTLEEGTIGDIIHVNWSEAWRILSRIRDDENSWDWQADKGGGMLGRLAHT